ncbi:MAG TPA: 3-hydroxyacyl-CoA dehydrogenase, partial [Exiguobacterium sp.]|nr:3-hydroxyacyl-CoA dehydrogenase [Exiguobacterium sp.]
MVEQIVVVGSGVMGRGIAYVAAHRGFQVTLVDIKEAYVESAYQELERIAEKGITRG